MVSDRLLGLAAEAYGFDASTLALISTTTNVVYHFCRDGAPYILRLSQRPAEALPRVIAEMDWLDYLARHGISVSLPLRSRSGELAIAVTEDGQGYILAAFAMAGGRFWDKKDKARWNATVFTNWGRVMGEMHRLTKVYAPPDDRTVRDTFAEREAIPDKLQACPSVYAIGQALLHEILSLPIESDGYGLIHYDLHPWNMLLEGDRINVFDFDDCLYGWFALDMGVALYHGLWWGRHDGAKPVPNDLSASLIRNFVRGYLSRNSLSRYWLAKVPLFMRYRQICKFSWFFDPDHIDEEQRTRIRNIERGVLFSDCEPHEALFCLDRYT